MRPAVRGSARVPVRDQLLPGGDVVHPVRHRGHLSVSDRRPAQGVWDICDGGDRRGCHLADGRLRVRLAAGSARVEIKREPLTGKPGSQPRDLIVEKVRAHDMLTGNLEGEDLERYVEERVLTTTMDRAVAWARGNSFFPLTFGLACCAIEMMSIVGARMDIARF